MISQTDIDDMTDERAEIARAACALDETLAGRCATEGCTRAGVIYFESGGIGSHYCSFCHAGLRPDAPEKVWAWANAGWSVAGASALSSANDGESVLYVRADLARPSQHMAGDERVRRLIEALQPFADMAEAYDPEGDGMDDDYSWYPGARPAIGDLRRARAALSAMDTPKGGWE